MIIKSFEFPSNVPLSYSQDGSEETWGFPIEFGNNYSFIIGKRDKPTAEEREAIESEIGRAWEGIFGSSGNQSITPPIYSVSTIHDPTAAAIGEPELPALSIGHFYILFILMESPEALIEDAREITGEITKTIRRQFEGGSGSPRIGVVTLYNASVTMVQGIASREAASEYAVIEGIEEL